MSEASAVASNASSGASSASSAFNARPFVAGRQSCKRVALTYAATLVVALAAHHAGRPDLIRSPKRVLAHLWEGDL